MAGKNGGKKWREKMAGKPPRGLPAVEIGRLEKRVLELLLKGRKLREEVTLRGKHVIRTLNLPKKYRRINTCRRISIGELNSAKLEKFSDLFVDEVVLVEEKVEVFYEFREKIRGHSVLELFRGNVYSRRMHGELKKSEN
jgi:hypothetical protein